jgi:hypothetical protein
MVLITKPATNLNPKPEVEAAFMIGKDQTVAVDDYTFQLLNDGCHMGTKKLFEVSEPND